MLYVWRGEVLIIQNCDYWECLFWKFGKYHPCQEKSEVLAQDLLIKMVWVKNSNIHLTKYEALEFLIKHIHWVNRKSCALRVKRWSDYYSKLWLLSMSFLKVWKIPSMSRKEWGSGPRFANQNGLSEEFQHSLDKIGGIGISYWAYTLGR